MTDPVTLSRPLAGRLSALGNLLEMAGDASEVPAAVIQAAADALARGETHYTDRAGILPLRSLVAERLMTQAGISVDPKAITITCGLIEAQSIALRILGQSDVLCPQLLPEIIELAHLIGLRVVRTASETQSIGLAYLTPADPPDQIAAAIQSGVPMIWDLSIAGTALHPASDPSITPRMTTVDSLDDSLPGWRVGWLAGSAMADRLRGFKQALTICTTSVSQWAAVEWLKTT